MFGNIAHDVIGKGQRKAVAAADAVGVQQPYFQRKGQVSAQVIEAEHLLVGAKA